MDRLVQVLNSLPYPFAHFAWEHAPAGTYGVYMENGQEEFRAGGHVVEWKTVGTVDLFTKDSSGTPKDKVEEALNGLELFAWHLESVQYEEETHFIHYEWYFEVI